VLVVVGATAARALYFVYPVQVSTIAGLTLGTTTTELNAVYKGAVAVAPLPAAEAPSPSAAGDWPSYNKTLTSEGFSPLSEINTKNVGKLKVLCTYAIDPLLLSPV
jgi:alcohol dehydrogenase (cytochrome c)